MGGSEQWFQNYETMYNEREAGEIEATDEELSDMATEMVIDQMADRADILHDQKKEHG